MRDLMIDIETLGTGINSVITQIGACYFDRYTGTIGETFIVNIRIQDCLDKGLEVDGGAIKFWFEQSHQDFLQAPIDLEKALGQFKKFCKKDINVWAHSTFDFPIIGNAYRVIKQGLPYHYRSTRDIRTLVDLSGIAYKKYVREGVHHNALDDCKFQVKYCSDCFKTLKGNK